MQQKSEEGCGRGRANDLPRNFNSDWSIVPLQLICVQAPVNAEAMPSRGGLCWVAVQACAATTGRVLEQCQCNNNARLVIDVQKPENLS